MVVLLKGIQLLDVGIVLGSDRTVGLNAIGIETSGIET
jgi:hypothetical protein